METIIASCITGFVSLVVCLLANRGQAAKTEALIEYQLRELQAKVEKHNNLIERTYNLEQRIAINEQKIAVADHRIGDLEKEVRHE